MNHELPTTNLLPSNIRHLRFTKYHSLSYFANSKKTGGTNLSRACKLLVNIRTPTTINNTPAIISAHRINFLYFSKIRINRPTKKPVRIKGIPRPKEYTPKRIMPLRTVSWVAAIASIPASIGPTHGVQPKANARPITKAPSAPGESVFTFMLFW